MLNEKRSMEDGEDSIDLLAFVRRLYDEKRTITFVTFVAAVIATAIAFSLPNLYTSTASFIPPNLTSGSSMATALAGQLSAAGAGGLLGAAKNSGDLYAGILKSQSIAGALVKRFNLTQLYRVPKESQAEKVLAGNTSIVVDAKTSIVSVSVTDKSPTRARDLAAAYMEALRETEGRLALSQSSQRRLFFGQQLAKEKDDLENAEVDLKQTEERSGLIAPVGQTEAQIRTLAETQAQIAVRQVQLAALRQSATDENPGVIRLRSEIGDLEGQLARLQRGSSTASSAAIPTSRVPQLQLEYVRKEREVKYHEALFEALSRQYEAARLDEARDAPVLQLLDPASYPDTKSSPRRMFFALGGLAAGFLAGCAWVLARARLRGLVRSLRGV